MSSRDDEITLDDVETAIAVITKWLSAKRRIEGLLRTVQPAERGGYGMQGFTLENIVGKVMEEKSKQSEAHADAVEIAKTVLSPEEKDKMTKLTEKYRKRKIASTQQQHV